MAEGNWPDDVPKDAGALNAIKSAIRVLEKQMVPARADEIAREVAKMRIHYHAPKWTEAHVDQIVEDWIKSLEGYPAALISWAFDEHRAGPECSFPPLPGHILEHMREPMNNRRKIMRGLRAAHERLLAALDTSRQITGPTQAEQDAARNAGVELIGKLVTRLTGRTTEGE